MFQFARLNTAKYAAFQVRAFSAGPMLAAKAVAAKSKKVVSPEAKALEKELKKEKLTLAKLAAKVKKVEESEKEKKTQASIERREKKALKPYKKLSPLNVFIKENYKSLGSLKDASHKWTELTESEKEPFVQKAEKLNAENLKLYTPKPVSPAPAYARFTKANWVSNEDFSVASKAAAEKWRQLTKEEKDAYSPKPEEWEAYRKAFASWREERIKLYASKL
ncbi:hypothetical protein OXX69_008549 [Metschnikowia pulcherrima]